MTDHARAIEAGARAAQPSNEQRYYDALKTIARDYMTIEQMERDAKNVGCSPHEYVEMAYENVKAVAERAIKGKRRPK